jgi:eukaryotic-like serine/threonine-protein kinase
VGAGVVRLWPLGGSTRAYTPTVVDAEVHAPAQLGPGTVLAERYRIVRCIAHGGMGSVWEAEHLALAQPVAIKVIHPALVHDERARARFVREARAAAALRHPNVVQIHDYGMDGNVPYIAMELLDGEPLSRRIDRGPLPPAEVLELVTQIGRAIAKAHDVGVVHRDLKPDNVVVVAGDDGEVAKVLDFGIAKHADAGVDGTTKAGGMLGTPCYTSPEQLVAPGLADARADLWSLAVITYECLLGRRPFQAASVAELAVAVLAEPAPVPSAHGRVPIEFDAWFERATRREPDERFQDVHEMLDALARALRSPVAAPGPKRATSSRIAGTAIATALVGAVVLVAFALFDRPSAPSSFASTPTEATPAAAPAPPPVRVDAVPATPAVAEPSASAPPTEPATGETTRKRSATKRPRARTGERRVDPSRGHDLDELEP